MKIFTSLFCPITYQTKRHFLLLLGEIVLSYEVVWAGQKLKFSKDCKTFGNRLYEKKAGKVVVSFCHTPSVTVFTRRGLKRFGRETKKRPH